MDISNTPSKIRMIPREERANAFTHGLGVLLCLIAVPILIYEGSSSSNLYQLIGLGAFGTSMLMVYLSSTIYHSVSSPPLKNLWHRIDHISIYFLIAGTHTPFLLYFSFGNQSRYFLYALWGMVALGVLYKLLYFGRLKLLSVFYYVIMGWMAIFTIPPMLQAMEGEILFWIFTGGIFYSIGVVFFLWEKLPYHHAIWHLFVLAGSAGHFFAMWLMVKN
jgi:hemolysin III